MDFDAKNFILSCLDVAVEAASAHKTLSAHLPADNKSPAIVISAGKAGASMAAAFENCWKGQIKGLAVAPYYHGEYLKHLELIEASHPIPDHMSVTASKKVFDLASNLSEEDTVFVLLSGGSSSLLSYPAGQFDFSEKQKINSLLLRSGADINEINCIRKHLSAIKGGRLAAHCHPAKLYTLAISDVVGDDPSVIGSGPTVADPTTSRDAIEILKKYDISTSGTVRHWLESPQSETLKDDFECTNYKIIASATTMLNEVAQFAKKSNIDVINLGELDGNARELGLETANYLKTIKPTKPTLVISGGETTVKVRGNGRGGRNGEYLLSLGLSLNDDGNIYALAADTDGIDGSEDNAGAIITPDTLRRAKELGLDLGTMLNNNDSYSAFSKLADLIITGPTRTNVNDFRAALIMPENF